MTHEELIEEIKKLGLLHNSGVLSETEFNEMKQKLLSQVTEHDNSVRKNEIKDTNASKSIENRNQDVTRVKSKDIPTSQKSKLIAGAVFGVLALLAITFVGYRSFTNGASREDTSTNLDSIDMVVEAIEAEETTIPREVEEETYTDERFFYEGPYSIFGLNGRAKYSYRFDDILNTIFDGPFEFDEGLYQEDGTFNGMGSGVAHVSGQFKNGKQHGKWEIGSGHWGISVEFRDGVPNGKFRWSFGGGYGYGECKGTYKNGKLVGDFSYEANEGGEESYIKGAFDSEGKPKGIWEERKPGGEMRWYVMDKTTADEKGVQGCYGEGYIHFENLDLTDRMLDISEYVLSKDVTKQNFEYMPYWKN